MKEDDKYGALKNLVKRPAKDAGGEKGGETGYELTPKGIFYMALYDAYGDSVDDKAMRDMNRFDAFQKAALKCLSQKASNGQHDCLFGADFNQFFAMCINAINLCGKMQKILQDHGIDVDLSDLGDDGEDA